MTIVGATLVQQGHVQSPDGGKGFPLRDEECVAPFRTDDGLSFPSRRNFIRAW